MNGSRAYNGNTRVLFDPALASPIDRQGNVDHMFDTPWLLKMGGKSYYDWGIPIRSWRFIHYPSASIPGYVAPVCNSCKVKCLADSVEATFNPLTDDVHEIELCIYRKCLIRKVEVALSNRTPSKSLELSLNHTEYHETHAWDHGEFISDAEALHAPIVSVNFWQGGWLIESISRRCLPIAYCDELQCVFCNNFLKNPHCKPFVAYVMGAMLYLLASALSGLTIVALLSAARQRLVRIILTPRTTSLLARMLRVRASEESIELEGTAVRSALIRRPNRVTRRKIQWLRNRLRRNYPIRSAFLSRSLSRQSLRIATTAVVIMIIVPAISACKRDIVLTAFNETKDPRTGDKLFMFHSTLMQPLAQSLSPMCVFLKGTNEEPLIALRIDLERTLLKCNENVSTFTRDVTFDQFFLEDRGNHDCHESNRTKLISHQFRNAQHSVAKKPLSFPLPGCLYEVTYVSPLNYHIGRLFTCMNWTTGIQVKYTWISSWGIQERLMFLSDTPEAKKWGYV